MPGPVVVPVVLSGGSGVRLWPLSRDATPKQFHALVGTTTLFQQTVERALRVPQAQSPIVVCNALHKTLVEAQLAAMGQAAGAVLLEPAGRNTAPAVAAAALVALAQYGDDAQLLVLSADHVIQSDAAFVAAVAAAQDPARAGHLVAFGITPTAPETGYGYLRKGAAFGEWSLLAEFVEKPDLATAKRYLDSGEYLWNGGMFLFAAVAYLDELERHAPDIAAAVRAAYSEGTRSGACLDLGAAFLECPSNSIDYAVMEHTDKAAVVPLDAGWSDIGSWSAVHEALGRDDDGNVTLGDVAVHDTHGSLIAARSRQVSVVGLDNVIVVETEDAVLVMAKDRCQELKDLVAKLSGDLR